MKGASSKVSADHKDRPEDHFNPAYNVLKQNQMILKESINGTVRLMNNYDDSVLLFSFIPTGDAVSIWTRLKAPRWHLLGHLKYK